MKASSSRLVRPSGRRPVAPVSAHRGPPVTLKSSETFYQIDKMGLMIGEFPAGKPAFTPV
jgi:hypothetical protein